MGKQIDLFATMPSAVFSPCEEHPVCLSDGCTGRRYRYRLHWPTGGVGSAGRCLFVLANPSTATAQKTDPTVAKCIRYATLWDFAWCDVANVRAWRETNPKLVPPDPFAIGPRNDEHIAEMVRAADLVVCGWGKLGGARGPEVLRLIRSLGKVPHAIRLTKAGEPGHPCRLAYALKPFAMEEA